MQTFLLTWNPGNKSPWGTFDADYEHVRERGFLDRRWSCGRSKRLRVGDRVFLLSPRPARILTDLPIPTPRGARGEAEIATIKADIARRINSDRSQRDAS